METKHSEHPHPPLSPDLLRKMHAYWRAANYLSVGQIYLYGNPLMKKPLTLERVKPRLLSHWGTTRGLNFIYVHLNRIIKQYDLNMLYVTGRDHGGAKTGALATSWHSNKFINCQCWSGVRSDPSMTINGVDLAGAATRVPHVQCFTVGYPIPGFNSSAQPCRRLREFWRTSESGVR